MRRRSFGCLGALGSLACLGAGLFLGLLLPESWREALMPGAHVPDEGPVRIIVQAPTPTPAPEKPLPTQLVIPPKQREVSRLYNGIQVRTAFDAQPGKTAAFEREAAPDYALDLQFQIKVPVPAATAADVAKSAPALAEALPKLPALLDKATVSNFYYGIYQLKTDFLRQSLPRLEALLPRDTFYDTDTILELQDPDTKRKALLIQSDMDVDSDGSDPDRTNDIDTSDPSFAPLTSYKWPRRTETPSALQKPFEDRIAKLEADEKATPAHHNADAVAIAALHNDIYQIEHYGSLIAKADPYIVLPGFMVRQTGHPYQPHLGDLAVVIAGNKVYPAIFGDIGPSYLLGEASVRLAQAIDPRSTPERSPVDKLAITYIVFPGTAETPPGPPDLDKMRERCQALVNEIGGSKNPLVPFSNPFAPKPTPTPSATPTPTPTPTPSLFPPPSPVKVASPTPSTSPSPAVSLTPAPAASPSAGSPASGH